LDDFSDFDAINGRRPKLFVFTLEGTVDALELTDVGFEISDHTTSAVKLLDKCHDLAICA
jgi:hypothetical protein